MFWPFSTIYSAILAVGDLVRALQFSLNAMRAETKLKLETIEREVIQMGIDLTGLKAAVAAVQTEVSETAAQVQKLRDQLAAGGDPAALQTELDAIAGKLNAAASSLNDLQDVSAGV